jgi:hypothetical protein
MSPSRNNKSAEKDRYIAKLELEVEELKTRCAVHQQKIKELQIEMNRMVVKVSNKKDLRSRYRWNTQDSTYAAAIGKFCKEWLFPRYKFFHDDWMEYSTSRKSLCAMVFKHCPVPAGGIGRISGRGSLPRLWRKNTPTCGATSTMTYARH